MVPGSGFQFWIIVFCDWVCPRLCQSPFSQDTGHLQLGFLRRALEHICSASVLLSIHCLKGNPYTDGRVCRTINYIWASARMEELCPNKLQRERDREERHKKNNLTCQDHDTTCNRKNATRHQGGSNMQIFVQLSGSINSPLQHIPACHSRETASADDRSLSFAFCFPLEGSSTVCYPL